MAEIKNEAIEKAENKTMMKNKKIWKHYKPVKIADHKAETLKKLALASDHTSLLDFLINQDSNDKHCHVP